MHEKSQTNHRGGGLVSCLADMPKKVTKASAPKKVSSRKVTSTDKSGTKAKKVTKAVKMQATAPAVAAASKSKGSVLRSASNANRQTTVSGKTLTPSQARLWNEAVAALDALRVQGELDPKELGAHC